MQFLDLAGVKRIKQYIDDSIVNFITNSVSNLTNYYLKSETYTKSEVEALIAAINQFHYEIAASTSAVSSPANNVLYLIGPTGTGEDKYEEYVYSSSNWVKIGDTSISLSGYVTTQTLNTALADYTNTTTLNTLLAGKQDVINDLSDIRTGSQNNVKYTSQSLTSTQKAQARANIGAGTYSKPSSGIPATDLASGVVSVGLDNTGTLVSNISTINGLKYIDGYDGAVYALGPSNSDGNEDYILATTDFVESNYVDADTYDGDQETISGALTDLNTRVNGKQDSIVMLTYGTSTWNDFITAYNKNAVVYCYVPVDANGRLAFMAWKTPDFVEFQYYRTVSSHSATQQGDQVFIYKLTSANAWSTTTREAMMWTQAGNGLQRSVSGNNLTYSVKVPSNSGLTVNSSGVKVTTPLPSTSTSDNGKVLSVVDGAATWANDIIPTESTVSGWGFTKNTGTVTQVKVGSTSYDPSSGVVNLPDYPTTVWETSTGTNSVIVSTSLGTANGNYSTVEGKGSVTGGTHTGYDLTPDTADTTAGSYAHAEGRYTIACGKQGAHAEGDRTLANGAQSHAEGASTVASGQYSHAEGGLTKATAGGAHSEGIYSIASGSYSHAEGHTTISSGNISHSEGNYTKASGYISHAEGYHSISSGKGSHAEGNSIAYGDWSHSESGNSGCTVHPIGNANSTSYTIPKNEFLSVIDILDDATSINILKSCTICLRNANTIPTRIIDAVINNDTIVLTTEETLSTTDLSGNTDFLISTSIAYGFSSHSENEGSISYGQGSHAEGYLNISIGENSHVEGINNITKNDSEHAEGTYNVSNKASETYGDSGNTQHSIGIGDSTTRKNALEIMQNGDAYLYGVGSYNGTNYSSASTLQSILNNIPSAVTESTVSGWGFTKNAAPGTLNTNNSTAQTASASEALSGTINLHKIAKTGTYSDLIGTPTIPTIESLTTSEIDTIWNSTT